MPPSVYDLYPNPSSLLEREEVCEVFDTDLDGLYKQISTTLCIKKSPSEILCS